MKEPMSMDQSQLDGRKRMLQEIFSRPDNNIHNMEEITSSSPLFSWGKSAILNMDLITHFRYLQVLFNGIVIGGILYFLVQVALTIRRDVDLKVDEQLSSKIHIVDVILIIV